MKFIAIFTLFALASCQQQRTVTQDLQDAQSDLTVGHEWAEIFLVDNRQRLSDYLTAIEQGILDSFLIAYAGIKNVAIETREEISNIPSTPCTDNVRERYELQVSRYGQKLSQCLGVSNG